MTDQRYDKKSVTRITFYYNFISKASKRCDGESLLPDSCKIIYCFRTQEKHILQKQEKSPFLR